MQLELLAQIFCPCVLISFSPFPTHTWSKDCTRQRSKDCRVQLLLHMCVGKGEKEIKTQGQKIRASNSSCIVTFSVRQFRPVGTF